MIRHPVQLAFCSPTTTELGSILRKKPNNNLDCFEALRVYQIRYDEMFDYGNWFTDFVLDINDDALLNELRLRNALLDACFGYFRFVIYLTFFYILFITFMYFQTKDEFQSNDCSDC